MIFYFQSQQTLNDGAGVIAKPRDLSTISCCSSMRERSSKNL
jgi:hypothetical protein